MTRRTNPIAVPLLSIFLALVGVLAMTAVVPAATIVIINNDGAGEGFNDPTAVSPVGGNSGTTRGQQRLKVFEEAARIWGAILPSAVTIRVEATFDQLQCNSSGAVLGSAGPIDVAFDFSGAQFGNTWYHIALANKQHGSDLTPSGSDIRAQFNTSIDEADCLGSVSWYYGFDHAHGNNEDLLPVVLHELGHGLGFSTLTDLSTGSFLLGRADLFSRFILDNSTGKHWNDMTNGERQASAVNTGNVVWDGSAVTTHASSFLGPQPIVRVNSPAGLAGPLEFGTASFGPGLSSPGVTADVVLVDDGVAPSSDACSPIVSAAQLIGKIALIDRGTCAFVNKANAAQLAGAAAVVIVNNVSGAPPQMGASGSGSDPTITIPVISITLSDGNAIKSQLGSGVTMTLATDAAHLAGADNAGKVLLYAPNPLEIGSSISHWDPSATPDLLLEPFISGSLTSDVDLTRYLFEDIGWNPGDGGGNPDPPGPTVELSASAPNPFSSSASFSFNLDRAEPIELDIYDLNGRHVRALFHGPLAAGPHSELWDGTDDDGRRLPAGVYLYRLRVEGASKARRMVLVP